MLLSSTLFCVFVVVVYSETCIKNDRSLCSCSTSSYTIDLSPIASDSSISYPMTVTSGAYKYYYEPCGSFSMPAKVAKPACKDVAVCQTTVGKTPILYEPAGASSSAVFAGDARSHTLSLKYTSVSDDGTRISNVTLQCTNDVAVFEWKGQEVHGTDTTYNFILKTKYVCVAQSGLSTGSIMLIIFFVLLFAYFFFGWLIMRCVRGAEGIEQIPNSSFWTSLPGLIKDGAAFLGRGCKGESEQTYDKI